MIVHFFDRHRGIWGPGVPLPEAVATVAEHWEGKQGDLDAVAEALQRAAPEGEVTTTDIKTRGDGSDYGMITLRVPARGYPANCWRVLNYRQIEEEV